MRLLVLLLLLLLVYAAAHPAAVHTLVTLGAHALPALSHLGSAACGRTSAHAIMVADPPQRWVGVGALTPVDSHGNGAPVGSHWNAPAFVARSVGSHWNSQGA